MDQHVPALNQTSNQRFLEALFGDQWPGATVCSLANNQTDQWPAWRADKALPHLSPGHNNYYCVSLLTDPTSRRKVNFAVMRVLALDDVGEKSIAPDQIRAVLGEPTYRLETSPGSEHWGYRLDPPVTDPTRAARLQKRVTDAFYGGKDPGHNGVVRVMRLPQGANVRKGNYRCQLRQFDPLLGFDPAAIERALPMAGDEDANNSRHDLASDLTGEAAHDDPTADMPTPEPVQAAQDKRARPRGRPPSDPVLRAMHRLGMLHGPARQSAGGVGWDITCPWHAEHTPTGAANTGTFYFRGGGFKCWHGHCDQRGPADVRAKIDALVREDSGGVAGLDDLDPSKFDAVNPATVPASPVQARPPSPPPDVVTRFRRDIVYLLQEDRWLDLSTNTTMTDKALDHAWLDPLTGCLPINAKGHVVRPSVWARAEIHHKGVHARTWWPGQPVVFEDPNEPGAGRLLVNTWRDIERPLARVAWSALEAHVRGSDWWALVHAIAGATPEGQDNARRLISYMSMIVAAVGVKPAHNPLIIGPQGVGKDQIWAPLMRVLGERAISVSQSEFNSPFEHWVKHRLVTMAEIRRTTRGVTTDHDQYQILKRMCDAGRPMLSINQKFQHPMLVLNAFVLVMTSNEERPLTLPDDDRRIWVIRAQSTGWTVSRHLRLAAWMDAPSPWGATNNHAIVEFLTRYWDEGLMLSEVQGPAPMTRDKQALITLGRDTILDWLLDRLNRRAPDPLALYDLMTAREMVDLANAAIRSGGQGLPAGTRVPNAQQIGVLMRQAFFRELNGGQTVPTADGRRVIYAHRDAPVFYDTMSGPALGRAWDRQRNRRP